jgi:hypothetical protein
MIFGITQIKKVLILPVNMTYALRMMKACFFISSIDQSYLSCANCVYALMSVSINYDYPIVACVGDYKHWLINSLLFFNTNTLSGEFQVLGFCSNMELSLDYFLGKLIFSVFLE